MTTKALIIQTVSLIAIWALAMTAIWQFAYDGELTWDGKGPQACWVETKDDGSRERICGDVKKAPIGSHSFADSVPMEDEPAFDCLADGNRVCGPR